MITILQAIILGLIQGVTELFPVSSLGHTVIFPSLFGWNIDQNAPYFLTFLVATHFATAVVLFLFFWKEWKKIIIGTFRSLKNRGIAKGDTYAKLGWLLVIATIPAGIIGLLFQDSISKLLASAQIAAMFLIVNGVILYVAERLRRRGNDIKESETVSDKNIAKLSWWQSFGVGICQSAALLPGISRTGSAMAGGLFAGMNNEDAARYSFLLATPIIGAAALLKLPEIFSSSDSSMRTAIFAGAIAAAFAAFISVKFLVRYFKSNNLTPFAIYCFVAGIVYSIYFLVK